MATSRRTGSFRYPTDNRVRLPNGYVYVRPSSADGGKRRKRGYGSGGKGALYRLAKLFRKQRQTPMAVGGRLPGPYSDELAAERRSESPESPMAFRGQRSYSVGSRNTFKLIKLGKERDSETFFMWKPCKVRVRVLRCTGDRLSIASL